MNIKDFFSAVWNRHNKLKSKLHDENLINLEMAVHAIGSCKEISNNDLKIPATVMLIYPGFTTDMWMNELEMPDFKKEIIKTEFRKMVTSCLINNGGFVNRDLFPYGEFHVVFFGGDKENRAISFYNELVKSVLRTQFSDLIENKKYLNLDVAITNGYVEDNYPNSTFIFGRKTALDMLYKNKLDSKWIIAADLVLTDFIKQKTSLKPIRVNLFKNDENEEFQVNYFKNIG